MRNYGVNIEIIIQSMAAYNDIYIFLRYFMNSKLKDLADLIITKKPQDSEQKTDIKSLTWNKLFKMVFNHWLTYDEWIQAGKPSDKFYLFKWQEDLIRDIFQPLIDNFEEDDYHVRYAAAGAYGVGKSAALAIVAIMHMCFCYMFDKKRKYKAVVYSGSETQLRETLWDEVRIHAMHIKGIVHACQKLYIDRKKIGDFNLNDTNDYHISAETFNLTNKETKRGKHGGNVLVIFDEGTNMTDKMYDTADSFGTNARRVWLVMSNPTTTVGRFYQLFVDDFYKKHWIARNISVFDSYPDGHKYAHEKIDQYGEESDDVRVAVYGQFPKFSTGAIFPQMLIDIATARQLISHGDVCAIGVDLATERGRDYSTIAIKRPFCYASVSKHKLDVSTFLRVVVFDHIVNYRPIFVAIDRGGIGELPAQELEVFCRSYNVRVIPVDFGSRAIDRKYHNRRTELIFKVRDRLQDGYSMVKNPELLEEMTWLTYGNEYGVLKAVSKKDLPRSTDLLDAVMLTEAGEMITPSMVEQANYLRKRHEERFSMHDRDYNKPHDVF